jgi:hypothetical protein
MNIVVEGAVHVLGGLIKLDSDVCRKQYDIFKLNNALLKSAYYV